MKKKELIQKRKDIMSELVKTHGFTKKKVLIEHIRETPELEQFFYGVKKSTMYALIDMPKNDSEKATGNVTKSDTVPNDYKKKFVLSAWNTKTGTMMDIDSYCEHYKLPRLDITSYKLVSHTGTPYYNIVFKENVAENIKEFDFDGIMEKHINRAIKIDRNESYYDSLLLSNDFDTLTYTDVHVGMDTDSDNNSMYATEWNRDVILQAARDMLVETLKNKKSDILVVDELGDFLDGLNGYTTRGGHKLPQNMTDEEAYDCALEFKLTVADGLIPYYNHVTFNNICNDNHAGSFGYFVNRAFKLIVSKQYGSKATVRNYRRFINHYFVNDICYIITHGKDDKTLKFGFKPFLDSKGMEKIDQYCKQNSIYKEAKKIIFKKGDSHQCLFDMCTSDDFYYFNYPALSPSSQWAQNNFKKGRRGFVLETVKDLDIDIKVKFL